jgi:hypothetical protein
MGLLLLLQCVKPYSDRGQYSSRGHQNLGWKEAREAPEPMIGLSMVKELYPDADIEYVCFF